MNPCTAFPCESAKPPGLQPDFHRTVRRSVMQGLLLCFGLRSLDVGLLVFPALLVVDGLGIEGPDVWGTALHEVVDRPHGGGHRVVGVVVSMYCSRPDLSNTAE